MNKQGIEKIWPEALAILSSEGLDYSGYTARGVRGGIRIYDPAGTEVLYGMAYFVEHVVGHLRALPPLAELPVYTLTDEHDLSTLYRETILETLPCEWPPEHVSASMDRDGLPWRVGSGDVLVDINGTKVLCRYEIEPDIGWEPGNHRILIPIEAVTKILCCELPSVYEAREMQGRAANEEEGPW